MGTRLPSYSLIPSPPPSPVFGHLWDMLALFKKLGRSLGTRLHVGYAITGLGKSGTCIMGVMSQVVSVCIYYLDCGEY